MISETQQLIQACEWGVNNFIFFSENVFSALIYYSHLTPVAVALVFGLYIFLANRQSLLNRIFLFNALVLSTWMLLDLVLWATDSPRIVMFAWAVVNLLEPIIYAGFVYFTMVFIAGRDIHWKYKLLLVIPLLPTIALAPTAWNVAGFNLTNCDREVLEGPLTYYNYLIEILYAAWIAILGFGLFLRNEVVKQRGYSMLVVLFTLFLLLGFASGNIVGSFSEDWTIGQYGLFVIPVSFGALAYFVVQLRFVGRSQTMAAQILVIGLWLAVASILFIQNIAYIRWIVVATLVFLGIIGYLLIQSFRNEVRQRQEIERLADQLQQSNDQQSTLIRFITHQLKGFMAKSRNIFSMIQEGDFGPVPEPMKPLMTEGFNSATKGAQTIQEILNASNIKSGKVAYQKVPFDFAELVRSVVAVQAPIARAKNLALTLTGADEPLMLSGDRMQLENAVRNLVDNAVKYTLQGSVTIALTHDATATRLTITDTGVGITAEDMVNLFTEGGHGKESQKVNVDSTGFGLYIVKNIVEAHGGKAWAESEGAGKGALFHVELPA